MSWSFYFLLCVTGVASGFLNIIAGGGSMLTLPVMIFSGIDGTIANGTNRIAIFVQNLVASYLFFRKRAYDFRLAFVLSAYAVPGALAGAYLGTKLEGIWFNRILALVMFLMMFLMSSSPKKKKPSHSSKTPLESSVENEEKPESRLATFSESLDRVKQEKSVETYSSSQKKTAYFLMFCIGIYGGFIQVGVGFLLMFVLHRVLKMDLVRVNQYKVFIVFIYTCGALGIFVWKQQVLWGLGFYLALGNALGGWIGTHVALTKGEPLIRKVLNLTLVAIIIKLLFF